MAHPASASRKAFSSPLTLALGALALCVFNVVVRYPGVGNPDSDLQYAQILSGRFDDWHPPIMARLWGLLHVFVDGTAPIYLVHLATWWAGIGIVATTLADAGRPRAAWVLLFVAIAPPLVALDTAITKDVGLAAALVAAFAIVHAFRSRARSVPVGAVLAAGVLIVYATLVRTNAVFAIGPITLYLVAGEWPGPRRVVVVSLLLAVVLVPLSTAVNRHVLGATPAEALRSLQLFDLFGIARLSGDDGVLVVDAPVAADDCYTPIAWDTTADRCPAIADPLWADPALASRWATAILRHPLAYATHRLLAFNAMLYLDVPAAPLDLVQSPPTDEGRGLFALLVLDLVRTNLFTSPATVVAWSIALLLAAGFARTERHRERDAGEALAWSVVLYAASFLVVGVGTGLRYFLWPTIATAVATIVSFPCWLPLLRRGGVAAGIVASPLAIVLTIQVVARLSGHAAALLR